MYRDNVSQTHRLCQVLIYKNLPCLCSAPTILPQELTGPQCCETHVWPMMLCNKEGSNYFFHLLPRPFRIYYLVFLYLTRVSWWSSADFLGGSELSNTSVKTCIIEKWDSDIILKCQVQHSLCANSTNMAIVSLLKLANISTPKTLAHLQTVIKVSAQPDTLKCVSTFAGLVGANLAVTAHTCMMSLCPMVILSML